MNMTIANHERGALAVCPSETESVLCGVHSNATPAPCDVGASVISLLVLDEWVNRVVAAYQEFADWMFAGVANYYNDAAEHGKDCS